MHYIVITWQATWSCRCTYTKNFDDNLEDARNFAKERHGVIIRTDFRENYEEQKKSDKNLSLISTP